MIKTRLYTAVVCISVFSFKTTQCLVYRSLGNSSNWRDNKSSVMISLVYEHILERCTPAMTSTSLRNFNFLKNLFYLGCTKTFVLTTSRPSPHTPRILNVCEEWNVFQCHKLYWLRWLEVCSGTFPRGSVNIPGASGVTFPSPVHVNPAASVTTTLSQLGYTGRHSDQLSH